MARIGKAVILGNSHAHKSHRPFNTGDILAELHAFRRSISQRAHWDTWRNGKMFRHIRVSIIIARYLPFMPTLSSAHVAAVETSPTADGTKTPKPLIFLAAVGATFNRRPVDTGRGSFRPDLPQISRFCRYGVYGSAQACLKFCTFSSPACGSASYQPTFRAGIENGPLARRSGGRRFKQSSKGKRGRRKKKASQGGPASLRPPRSVSPWYIEISPSRCWPKFRWSRPEKDSTRARTIMWGSGRRGGGCRTAPTRADTRASRGPAPTIDVFSIPRQSDIIRV